MTKQRTKDILEKLRVVQEDIRFFAPTTDGSDAAEHIEEAINLILIGRSKHERA